MKRYCFVLLLIFFYACSSNNKNTEPQVQISPKTMSEIFTDIVKAERLSAKNVGSKEEREQIFSQYKKSIFSHYNITEKQYKETLKIYLSNPKLMEKFNKYLPDNSQNVLESFTE
ncbi:MAG: DUF4296 domain-containing protein [Bacteroidales bacterium]|nr:DUF4296 domain-containing protein [Bacteroidales bacterium]